MWRVQYKKAFLRELKKLPKEARPDVEEFVFVMLPASSDPLTLPNIKKLVGHQEFFRARLGDYRIGLRIDSQAKVIECCRVKHRRDIYRFYP
jgi:mRNA interferase RelE/StbE